MKSGFRATSIFPFNPFIIPEAFGPSTATEQSPLNTDIVDNTLPSTSSQKQLTDNPSHPVAGTFGLQKNVRQQHHMPFSNSLFDSDSSEVLDEPPNLLDDSDNFDSSESDKNSSHNNSFIEILSTPKIKRKTTRVMKPAINSRGVILKKDLFKVKEQDKENVRPTTNKKLEDSTKAKRKAVLKKTLSKKAEGWYCTLCCTDEVKDMRLCGVCGMYVHKECVGLTKKDKDLFVCPNCVQ